MPRILGVAALFSGAALLTHIVAGVSLRLALALTAFLLVLAVGLVWKKTPPERRGRLAQRARVGMLAGVVATVAYDIAKYSLSQLDPTPYNPFEAIRVFGMLLAGKSAHSAVVIAAGSAFHLLNGISFGIAFCFLFRRPGILLGIVWGFFLEIFQLTLYPGWLDIRFYNEFVQISTLGHVVYGGILGLGCRRALARNARSSAP